MGNQQESQNNILLENIPNDIKLSKRISGREKEFITDIHNTYDELESKYGLSRDQAKKIKNKVYNVYENCIPHGYKEVSYSKTHAVNDCGDVINIRHRATLKPGVNKKGYLTVCLENKRTRAIHRLVAETFIPNPENKPQVNHIDGNKQNNNVDNLEWCTNSENIRHAFDNNLIDTNKISQAMSGTNNHRAKLTEQEVREIRDLCYLNNDSEIAKLYFVSRSLISLIRNNKNWKHIK